MCYAVERCEQVCHGLWLWQRQRLAVAREDVLVHVTLPEHQLAGHAVVLAVVQEPLGRQAGRHRCQNEEHVASRS